MKSIVDYYDQYKASQDYLNETLEILARLSGNKIDLRPGQHIKQDDRRVD